MPDRATISLPVLSAAALLALAACDRSPSDKELAKLDNQIAGNAADPAVSEAINDPIGVDPTLKQQSNRNAVRTTPRPAQAQYPAPRTPAERQAEQAAAQVGGCAGGPFSYDMAYARRLPAAFPLFPGARVTEAAGNDRGDCNMRVVTFAAAAPAERVLGWYRDRALDAGYSAETQRRDGDHVLAGVSGDAAYYLIVTPGQRGSEVALIADGG